MRTHSILLSMLVFGCNVDSRDGSQQIVGQANDIGVVSISIDRYETDGVDVFDLRGLDAAGEQVALVRRRVGAIADLTDHLPGPDNVGSELIFDAAGHELRFVSRETELFQLQAMSDPTIQDFLELRAVASALRDVNIVVAPRPADSSEQPYTTTVITESCPTQYENTAPLAKQCCYYSYYFQIYNFPPTKVQYTNFVVPTNYPTNPGALIQKSQNLNNGAACKASDGTSSCSGRNCVYGPNGFARPTVAIPSPSTPYWQVTSNVCAASQFATPQTPVWPDVTGTFASNCGCCGNGTGVCCGTACNACTVAPQDAGITQWNVP